MSRIKFAKSLGATCKNPQYAWSYINEAEGFVLFGAWKHEEVGESQLIFSTNWKLKEVSPGTFHQQKGYRLSRGHIDRILEDGFRLFTFSIAAVEGTEKGKVKTKSFSPKPVEKTLRQAGVDFFADPYTGEQEEHRPKEGEIFWEGARKEVVQTHYERNRDARKKCLEEFGFSCSVCGINFENIYGDLGKGYIHVHHLTKVSERVSERGTAYKVDPLKDLRPVCPNCHAMIHMRNDMLSIEALRRLMESQLP